MTIRSIMAAVALGLCAAFAANAASAMTLRFAEFGPNRGVRAEALKWFANEIEERSDGSLEIEFLWGGSLLNTSAVLQGVATGVADMGSVIGFLTPQELKGYNIGDLPVENSDVWVGMRALFDLSNTHPAMQQEFEGAGVRYVTNYSTGPIQLICTRKVDSLADLQNLKVRASGAYGKALSDLGADVQQMPQPKVYQALDSGLIDCNQNYYYSIRAYRQYEVAPYVLELNWGQNMSFGIVMNEWTYQSLSEKQQQVIQSVGDDFIDHFAQAMIESARTDKAAMIEGIDGASIEVAHLPEGEREKLIEAGKKYVDIWVDEAKAAGMDGEDILATYQELIDKYAAERDAKGYPWTR